VAKLEAMETLLVRGNLSTVSSQVSWASAVVALPHGIPLVSVIVIHLSVDRLSLVEVWLSNEGRDWLEDWIRMVGDGLLNHLERDRRWDAASGLRSPHGWRCEAWSDERLTRGKLAFRHTLLHDGGSGKESGGSRGPLNRAHLRWVEEPRLLLSLTLLHKLWWHVVVHWLKYHRVLDVPRLLLELLELLKYHGVLDVPRLLLELLELLFHEGRDHWHEVTGSLALLFCQPKVLDLLDDAEIFFGRHQRRCRRLHGRGHLPISPLFRGDFLFKSGGRLRRHFRFTIQRRKSNCHFGGIIVI